MVSHQRKIKMIIADDHPVFRSGLEAVVESMNSIAKISQAANGEEVIKLLKQEHYDIVLMDITMSPMGGIEATAIIKKRHPNTKVIALSMHDDKAHILEILDKGAVGYLIKNANKEEIFEAITEVMNGGTYYSKPIAQIMYDQLNKVTIETTFISNSDILSHERFRDIIFLVINEFTNVEIADALCLSPRTIEDYRKKIIELTKTKTTVGLVKYAMEQGILNFDILKKKHAKALSKKELKI